MKTNTSKEKSFYTQGQRFTARVLFIVWLLASISPEGTLAAPKGQMTPDTTPSPGDPSLASALHTLPPGGTLQLPPDAPGSFWGDSVASSPAIDAALQERMSQEAAPFRGGELLRTSPKVSPASKNFSFEARGGEKVRFSCQQGQWHAEVSSHIGAFSRSAVLPVVCSSGENVASSLEVLSRYASWYSHRQIHVLDRNMCPTLGEVVYVGELGLKGGGDASGSGEQEGERQLEAVSHPLQRESLKSCDSFCTAASSESQILIQELKDLASDPQLDQQPDKLAELGVVLLTLAISKQEEAGTSHQDLSLYTDAAILYQHVLSICEQKASTLGSQAASSLAQSAYQGLAQIQALMLARAKGVASQAVTVEEVQDRIRADKQSLEATRTKAREEAKRLAEFRDQQGSAEEVLAAEAVYIEGSKKLFADIAEQTKSLLANFYQEGEAALGPPPCKYAVMGLGSVALQQTTPYSDLEFAILMEDTPDEAKAETWRAYLRNLTHLVHFRVINLGETVLPFSEYKISLDHLGKRGLNFDLGGKTPLGRKDKPHLNQPYELIQTVEGMLKYLKNEDGKMEHMDKLLPFILESTCHVHGDSTLHDKYVAEQRKFFTSQDPAGRHASQERMMKKLLEGVSELDYSQPIAKAGRRQEGDIAGHTPKLHPDDAGRLYDVKQEIYRLPDRLIYGLAMYFGICPESGWDAVEQLKQQGIIGQGKAAQQAGHHLKYALSFATMLRLTTYLHQRQQSETLAGSTSKRQSVSTTSEIFTLPEEALQEGGSLFKYYYTALPLHQRMEEFFAVLHLRPQVRQNLALERTGVFDQAGKFLPSQAHKYFASEPFYDDSCAVKVSVYHRLLQYEAAQACAERHWKEVESCQTHNHPKRARYHHNLAIAYYHLGKYHESDNHFGTALDLLSDLLQQATPLQKLRYERYLAKIFRNRGIAHYNMGRFEESHKDFEKSLEKFKALYGGDSHPEIAQTLLILAEAYAALENFAASLEQKQDALKMLQALYTDSHPDIARALRSVGDAYQGLGKFQESLEQQEASLAMFKVLGDRLEIARSLRSVGDAYEGLGRFEASVEQKQEALKLLSGLYAGPHAEIARTLLSLGEAYQGLGRFEESLDHNERSLSMFKELYPGPGTHPEVAQAQDSVIKAHEKLKNPEPSLVAVTAKLPSVCTTVAPLPLILIETPKHYQEAPGENTLLRSYYSGAEFPYVQSLFDEQRSKHVDTLECQLMLFEQKLIKQAISFEEAIQLRNLALQDPTPENRKKNIEHLISLVQPSSGESDTDVLAGLLNGLALVAVQSQAERTEEAAMAGKALEGLTAKAPADHWLAEETLPDKLQHFKKQFPQPIPPEQDRRFIQIIRASGPATTNRADHIAKHHERLEWVKTSIAFQDLFKKRSTKPGEPEKEINRILLTGDPGTGKTTLSKKLAYQWAAGTWGQEFHTLYLLPVRNLQQHEYDGIRYNREKALATAIVNNCFTHPPSDEDEYKQLRKHIEEELQKPTTLVILDGLDERAGASEEILRQAQDQTAGYKLLMLSRPYGVDTARRLVNIEIEHAGFNDDQLRSYVREEVSDGKLAAELLGYIEQHENIRSIAHVPVNLQILCALWQDHQGYSIRQELAQGSLPGLYGKLTELVWRRYKERRQEGVSVQDREHLFDKLGQIALSALEAGEILIGPGLIDRALTDRATDAEEVKNKCKDAGFLLLQYVGEDPDKKSGFYQFPHLTFQEYFAGRALAQQFLSENKREKKRTSTFLSEHKYEDQYGRTLSFMAGEVSRIEEMEGIRELLKLLEEGKEVVGLQHLLLQLRVIHECIASEQEAERGMTVLEELGVIASLQEWFSRWIALRKKRYYTVERTAGEQLLETLVQALSRIGAVLAHAPTILSPLRQAAKDEDSDVRQAAVEALANLKPLDPASLTVLCQAAKDKDWHVRQAAVQALANLKTLDPESLTVLLNATKDWASDVRQAAVQALANLKSLDPESLAVLHEATKDPDGNVRYAAVQALANLKSLDPESLTVLRKATEDQNWSVRHAAVQALGNLKPLDPASLTVLRKATEDQNWSVRHAAVQALGNLKPLDPASLTILREATKDTDRDVRQAAVQALQNLKTLDPASLTILRKATKDTDRDVRQAAVQALASLKTLDPASLTVLLRSTKDTDRDVRHAAVQALASLKAQDLASFLREATKNQDSTVRHAAVQALASLETLDPASLTVLLRSTKDTDRDVRQAAVQALGNLKHLDPASLTVLLEATKVQDSHAYHAAVQALGNLKDPDPAFLTVLCKATKDTDRDVRQAAFQALASLKTLDPASLTVLLRSTKDTDRDVRHAAVQALANLTTLDPASLTVLHEATKDQYWGVRHAAVQALGNLKTLDPASLTVLRQATEDQHGNVRHAAVQALASLETLDSAFLTVLRNATEDEDWQVRQAAVQALRSLKTLDPASLTVLHQATKDQDRWVRHAAVQALQNLETLDPASLTVLHQAIKDQDWLVRKAAVGILASLKTLDPASLTVLHQATKDQDSNVRHAAVQALQNLETLDPASLTVLLNTTKDEDRDVRQAAFQVLANLKNLDPASLTVLLNVTKDQDSGVRHAAVQALQNLETLDPASLTVLQEATKDQDSDVRHAAVQALRHLKTLDPASLTVLRNATEDQHGNVRHAAVQALGNLKILDPASLTVLRNATEDQHGYVRHAAVQALQNLKIIDPASLTVLRNATEDQYGYVRHAAVKTLGNLKTLDPASLTVLLKTTKDQHGYVRHVTVQALQNLKILDPASLTVLLNATKDEDSNVRQAAVQALGNLKTLDPASLTLLLKATKGQDGDVRHAAVQALQNLKVIDPASLTLLLNATKDEDSNVRQAAVQALGNLKTLDPASLTLLLKATKGQDDDVRHAAVQALQNLKVIDPASLTLLLKATKGQDGDVRHAAVQALSSLKATDTEFLTVLRKATKDPDRDVRDAAVQALQNLKVIDSESLTVLRQATKDQDSDVRHAAVQALASLKTQDLASLTALHEATKDQDSDVRHAAVKALASLKTLDPASLTVLRNATKDQDSDVRRVAVQALASQKNLDSASLTVLRNATKDQDSGVRRVAVQALASQKNLDSASLTVLREATKDQDSGVRRVAVQAFAKIPTEQYIDGYWATKDRQLVPYIAYRLYQTPLVIDQKQATLYQTAGQRKTWPKPGQTITREEMERFKQLIQRAA